MSESEDGVRWLLAKVQEELMRKLEPLVRPYQQAMDLLKEFPGRYEDMQLYDYSLDDYYERVSAFLESLPKSEVQSDE